MIVMKVRISKYISFIKRAFLCDFYIYGGMLI